MVTVDDDFAEVYAVDVNDDPCAPRRWKLLHDDGGKLCAALPSFRRLNYTKMLKILPAQSRRATGEEMDTCNQVERAIAAGANLLSGSPAAMATCFPDGIRMLIQGLCSQIASSPYDRLEEVHSAASAALLARNLAIEIDMGILCLVCSDIPNKPSRICDTCVPA